MARLTPDLCVIGAGSGGLTVAAGAAQMGASVVLVEGGRMGGDCLNYGCVPSKALIAAAKQAHAMGAGARFGVAPAAAEADYAAVMEHVAGVIAEIAPHDSVERFEALGVKVLPAWGAFISPTELRAGDDVLAARRFVVATGSRPAIPPIPGLAETPHLTNETIFDLRARPERLLVIGGGPIGLELAQAHARLGSRVTVIEAETALGREDPELAAVALEAVRADGVEILERTRVETVRAGAGGPVILAGGREIEGSQLLVAAGRKATVEGLGLEAAGVEFDGRGVKVDSGLRTSNRRIYAIGDAAGGMQFTHLAGHQGGLVLRSALFRLPVRYRPELIPRVTFTDPELAQAGLTEAEARAAHGDRLEVLRFPFTENDRARAERRTEGLVKVMAVRGRPVGASVVGPQAGELIQLWALAIQSRLKLGAVAGMVAPYPTLGEASKGAAGRHFAPRLFESPWTKRVVRLLAKLG